MPKPKLPPTPTDDEVRALLVRYQCPVPFHAVRTRFLGNIATPAMQSAPMDTVAALWGGEMPVFESLDATNELIGALVMGLWNRLTRHQERSAPFRLTRIEVAVTREGMSRLARCAAKNSKASSRACSGTMTASIPRSVPTRRSACWPRYAPCWRGCAKWPTIPPTGVAGRHRRHARPSARVHPDHGTRDARAGAVLHACPAPDAGDDTGWQAGDALTNPAQPAACAAERNRKPA